MEQDNNNTQVSKRLLSVEETAHYLGISPRTIYNKIGRKSKNKFPVKPKRIGKLIKFDKHELDDFINALQGLKCIGITVQYNYLSNIFTYTDVELTHG